MFTIFVYISDIEFVQNNSQWFFDFAPSRAPEPISYNTNNQAVPFLIAHNFCVHGDSDQSRPNAENAPQNLMTWITITNRIICLDPISMLAIFVLLVCAICPIFASAGDRHPFHSACIRDCSKSNCSTAVSAQQRRLAGNPIEEYFHDLFMWKCHEHCIYDCMWQTTEYFVRSEYGIPQFYGKVRYYNWQSVIICA